METEAKFIVPDEATFARLRGEDRLGGYALRDTHVTSVHDRYLDTTDHRFYSQKFYARLRENKSGDLLLTVKRLGTPSKEGIYTRDEYQTPVQTLDVETWPEGETRDIVHTIAGDAPLSDFVTVDQTRTISYLVDGDRRIAEVSLDEVTIGTSGEPVQAYELEIELLPDGSMSDLRAITRSLTKTYKLTAQPLSKFERAIMLAPSLTEENPQVAPTPVTANVHAAENGETPSRVKEPVKAQAPSKVKSSPKAKAAPKTETTAQPEAVEAATPKVKLRAKAQAPTPEKTSAKGEETSTKDGTGLLAIDSMEVAIRKMLRTYFGNMVSNEGGTRSGRDPEALHDMRVATRRMRAVLQVFDPYISGKGVKKVRQGLTATTKALGTVRDLDVLIADAEHFRDSLPAEQQSDLDGLLKEWSERRDSARKGLLSLLKSNEYSKFKSSMKKFLNSKAENEDAASRTTDDVTPHQVRHVAGSAIWARYEEVRAFETVMDAPTISQLHALRVRGKYLRYTLECFRESLPTEASDLIGEITAMQDELGKMHDAEVAGLLIRSYLKDHHKQSKKRDAQQIPAGLEAYLANRESVVRTIHSDFAGTWSRIGGPEWRRRLVSVAAGL